MESMAVIVYHKEYTRVVFEKYSAPYELREIFLWIINKKSPTPITEMHMNISISMIWKKNIEVHTRLFINAMWPLRRLDMEAVFHYSDVIMDTMASQITSLAIVYSTVSLGADQRKKKAPSQWPLCGKFTGDRRIRTKKDQ